MRTVDVVMQRRVVAVVLFLWILGCSSAMSQADDLKPFPAAEAGESRNVIRLPVAEDETNRRVELVIGKEMEVDCNQHWYRGTFVRLTLPGWGYGFYRLSDVAGPASTRMACPPGEKKRQAFVEVRLDDALIRYNSKLPIVVYAPKAFSVRYRIWSVTETAVPAVVE